MSRTQMKGIWFNQLITNSNHELNGGGEGVNPPQSRSATEDKNINIMHNNSAKSKYVCIWFGGTFNLHTRTHRFETVHLLSPFDESFNFT